MQSGTAFEVEGHRRKHEKKARRPSSQFLAQRGTATKNKKKVPLRHFWCLVTPPKKTCKNMEKSALQRMLPTGLEGRLPGHVLKFKPTILCNMRSWNYTTFPEHFDMVGPSGGRRAGA